ncbi:MAG: hypothetical protein AAGC46_17625 [Solirubrobacteraceae bacterium]|nr:hypothetical protein [Patulibacter sp.]
MPRLRPALALLSLALAVPFAGCGDGQDPTTTASVESVYVTIGGLKYQVQMSRKLNPYDAEDRDYLAGVPHAAQDVANLKYTWFGVFLRVENDTNGKPQNDPRTITSASKFVLTDNENDTAYPTPLPSTNVFAYKAQALAPRGIIPNPSSTAAQAPIGGSLILFKVDQQLLERRPATLNITSADGTVTGRINLDV